jgi:hypothetical protein
MRRLGARHPAHTAPGDARLRATTIKTYTFLQSYRCPRVVDAEGFVYCMVCGVNRACGHTEVHGGEFDGRIVLMTCAGCGHPENESRRHHMLALHVQDGYLDLATGGPGVNGPASLRHNDHIDTLTDWKEHDE